MACKRPCFSTSCEVKQTCCTYFGIANFHGPVGEQVGSHIEKGLILTGYVVLIFLLHGPYLGWQHHVGVIIVGNST